MICYIERGVFASLSNDDILHHFQELKSRKKKLPKLPSSTTCGKFQITNVFHIQYYFFWSYLVTFQAFQFPGTNDEEMEDVNATNPH